METGVITFAKLKPTTSANPLPKEVLTTAMKCAKMEFGRALKQRFPSSLLLAMMGITIQGMAAMPFAEKNLAGTVPTALALKLAAMGLSFWPNVTMGI